MSGLMIVPTSSVRIATSTSVPVGCAGAIATASRVADPPNRLRAMIAQTTASISAPNISMSFLRFIASNDP